MRGGGSGVDVASGTTEVCWVTGKDSPVHTGSRAAVSATDLGILWDAGDSGVLVAFGDSYGTGWCGHGAGPRHADWRCNVLARAPLTEPSDRLMLGSWVEDAPGHAAQVLPRDPDAREETVIPTARDVGALLARPGAVDDELRGAVVVHRRGHR